MEPIQGPGYSGGPASTTLAAGTGAIGELDEAIG
jgi:hypothetical protein